MKKRWIAPALLAACVVGGVTASPSEAAYIGAALNVNTATPARTQPPIQMTTQDKLALDVNNNLQTPIVFEIPELGLQRPMGVGQDETMYIPAANLESPVTPYRVRDTSGNVLTTGTIVLTDMPSIAAADLSSIINYSTAYAVDAKRPPVYYQSAPSSTPRRYIRGYW
jgi:hypothetical protein